MSDIYTEMETLESEAGERTLTPGPPPPPTNPATNPTTNPATNPATNNQITPAPVYTYLGTIINMY